MTYRLQRMNSGVPDKFALGILLLFFLSGTGFSQVIKKNNIPVDKEVGKQLPYAWTGGWNSPQFSAIDLNLDGIEDLFVFDREGDRVMTFINKGTAGTVDYEYAPQYETGFPEMTYWALLADYNNDGKADIFTYNDGGIRVFKNISTTAAVAFELTQDPYIISHYDTHISSNLYCSSQDIPAIVDVDNDGDLDVLTFGSPSAQAVYFHENFAADSSDPESFKMYINTYCWGNFEEDLLTNSVVLGKSCPKSMSRLKHSGSTILALVCCRRSGNN